MSLRHVASGRDAEHFAKHGHEARRAFVAEVGTASAALLTDQLRKSIKARCVLILLDPLYPVACEGDDVAAGEEMNEVRLPIGPLHLEVGSRLVASDPEADEPDGDVGRDRPSWSSR